MRRRAPLPSRLPSCCPVRAAGGSRLDHGRPRSLTLRGLGGALRLGFLAVSLAPGGAVGGVGADEDPDAAARHPLLLVTVRVVHVHGAVVVECRHCGTRGGGGGGGDGWEHRASL